MEAIILAGGKGTRLQSVIADVPKPMAPIGNKPFLFFLLNKLKKEGFKKFILSVGYKYEVITNYFQESFEGIPIVYSIEESPLGTGGAVSKSLQYVNDENVFVINGDTYIDLNYSDMYRFHLETTADFSMSLKEMKNYSRYGTVHIDYKQKIIQFEEKKSKDIGYINSGVYCIKKEIQKYFQNQTHFSLETDFLEKNLENLKIYGFISNSYFIDIGIPEDYLKACEELKY